MCVGAPEALLSRVADIASATGRSPPFRPALAKDVELSDGLMVLALEAVEAYAAAAPTPKPSGVEQKRIMALLVADAMGFQRVLAGDDVTRAGKRIHKQANKVRDELAAACSETAAARADACAAAATDSKLQEALATALAEIDDKELTDVSKLAYEPYIGFHEITGGVAAAPALAATRRTFKLPGEAIVPKLPGWMQVQLEEEGCRELKSALADMPNLCDGFTEGLPAREEDAGDVLPVVCSVLGFVAGRLQLAQQLHAAALTTERERVAELEGDCERMRAEVWEMRQRSWEVDAEIAGLQKGRDEAVAAETALRATICQMYSEARSHS